MSPPRAVPMPTPDSEPFWHGCAAGELRMPRCVMCRQLNWFPRGICVQCGSDDFAWISLSGKGTVYSFSVVTRPASEAFTQTYVLALVDLDEGPRMMSHLVGIDPDAARIGARVAVRFDHLDSDIWLPVFAPDRGDG